MVDDKKVRIGVMPAVFGRHGRWVLGRWNVFFMVDGDWHGCDDRWQ